MNLKGKKKGVLLLVLLLVLLVCGGIYTAYRLHPENFVGKNDIITRGEFAAELAKELDLDTSKSEKDMPSFSDIDGHWAEKYIEALVDAGILDPADYPDGFKPDEPITRAEIIKMMVRAKGQDEEAKNTQGHSGYDDQSDIADNDKGYVIVGKEDGIIGDTEDNKLHPNDPVTKGEADDMIDKADPKPSTLTPTPSSPATDTPTQTPTPPGDEQTTPTPTDPDEEQPTPSPKPTPGGGSGGGSYHVPDAQVRFDLPETAHTDTEIKVMPVWKYMQSFTWSLTKTAVDGSEQPVELAEAINGSLGLEGGTIQFKEEGKYTLTATAKNTRGKETVLSKAVTVYPVIDLTFDLPETTHTDKSVTLTFPLEKLYGHDIVWTAEKDEETVQATDILDGTLTDEGGSIRFKDKGVYMLTGTLTDETGRTFEASQTVTVYPVGSVGFYLPEIAHTDTSVLVKATFQNLGTAEIQWSLTKDGEAVPVADYIDGTLTDTNSNVRFKEKGEYVLKAAFADPAGRTYSYSAPIKVYPVLSITYKLPVTAHTDTEVSVIPETLELGNLKVEWLLENGFGSQDFATYIDGTLDNNGGTIRFKHAGTYELIARITDESGRVFLYEDGGKIEVLPVLNISFELPASTHTDRTVDLRTRGNNNVLPVEWTLTKDGKPTELSEVLEGSLNAYGGKIQFKEVGEYILTASMTDALGRVFSYSASTTVYPIPSVLLDLPQTWYAEEAGIVSVSGTDLDDLAADWTIIQDDGGAQPYYIYASGTLDKTGGTITFLTKGQYKLILTMTDPTGRTFVRSQSFIVYPIPSMSIGLTQTWHAGEAGTVSVSGTDLDNLTAAWTIRQDDGEAKSYSAYTTGTLTKDGGAITFPTKGQYELILTMTDTTGRTFTRSRSFTISPIPTMNISIPALTHSGESLAVTASGTELGGASANWYISVDGGAAKPYTEYATGALGISGGALRLYTDKTISVKLQAVITDTNGRNFTFTSGTGTVKPIASFAFTLPSSAHIGSGFNVSLPSTSGLEGRTLTWSLTKDGNTAGYTGSLSNSGGTIAINTTGNYILTASTTDSADRTFSYSQGVTITNNAPNKPSGSASVTRTAKDGKLLVNLYAYASDPDGDSVTLEYSGNTSDSYYAVGSHTVKVRAKDVWGLYSDWTDISFTVTNSAPTTPVITRTPDGNSVAPGVAITITASSTDPDGDAITYVWEGRPAQTSTAYPLGKNVVRVKAVDSTGAESPWAAIVFFVADPNRGGGMTLTGPESVILEQGIAGATITNYTFTVPPVSGHSGQDFGRVRGYNILTGQWDQLDYGTTTNGITFSRTLPAGIYSQLEFYYYTNHDCMYNKSNITYSVTFYFQ